MDGFATVMDMIATQIARSSPCEKDIIRMPGTLQF